MAQRRIAPVTGLQTAIAPSPATPAILQPPTDRHRAAWRWATVGFLLVTVLHLWIISAGRITHLPNYSAYYDRLADSFLHGQTSLRLLPSEQHLALPDPYDPVANRRFRQQPGVHDAVLFNGKFYLYWGPVPAVFLAALRFASGIAAPVDPAARTYGIGDEYLAFAFVVGTTIFSTLLIRRLWGRFFNDQPPWTIFLGTVVAGLATPIAYLLARAAVYEAAIMGGQFFLLAGLHLAIGRGGERSGGVGERGSGGNKEIGSRATPVSPSALSPPLPHSPSPPLPASHLTLIGGLWTLAVGSRVSLAVAVSALAALVAWQVPLQGWKRSRQIDWLRLIALGTPLVAGAISLAAYNHVRFGTWREFGQRFQLTAANYKATPALFSPGNLLPSLYSYAMRPVQGGRNFPFISAKGGAGTFPRFITIPPHYEHHEPIAGLLLVAPFVWLAAIPVLRLAAAPFRRRGRQSGHALLKGDPHVGDARPRPSADEKTGVSLRSAPGVGGSTPGAFQTQPLAALRPSIHAGRGATRGLRSDGRESSHDERDANRAIILLLCAACLGFAPILFMLGSTMRYLADLWPSLAILALIGFWQRGRAVAGEPRRRRLFFAAVCGLAAFTVVVGMLLAVTGYYGHFQVNHPEWFGDASYRTASEPMEKDR